MKRLQFNPSASRDYLELQLEYYKKLKEEEFKRDNEGRERWDRFYSAEYWKLSGMEAAYEEILKYFDRLDW